MELLEKIDEVDPQIRALSLEIDVMELPSSEEYVTPKAAWKVKVGGDLSSFQKKLVLDLNNLFQALGVFPLYTLTVSSKRRECRKM